MNYDTERYLGGLGEISRPPFFFCGGATAFAAPNGQLDAIAASGAVLFKTVGKARNGGGFKHDIIGTMRSEFLNLAFLDPAKAEANLERLDQLLPAELRFPLASLLSQSPDPDGALNLLERYAAKTPAEVLADLARYPTALTCLVAIFGYSGYLAETFFGEPGLPVQFARDRNFTKLKSREDLMQDYARFTTAAPDPWLSAQLGRFKRRTYLRIVLKDVLGMSTLADTTLELSELADVIVINALIYCDQELRKRYGEPQYRDAQGRIARSEFSVISLGKMGGNELNYSSDIDLLFLYSHDGETSGGSEPDSIISNKEYFARLANAVTRTITQSTPYGQVFRVDLRLRPEGDQGDLTISLRSAREYYERRARDWELQMLIKARHSAGDERLTREFLRGVEPYIYGSPTDFAAIETVLLARERISRKLRESRADGIDVKHRRGGIRDIEFLAQCLQRLHGGHDPWVRSGGTLLALRKLNDKGWLSDKDYAALTSAYEYLRAVEHCLQLDQGQQTHRLPLNAEALDRLARRVGVERAAHTHSTDSGPATAASPGEMLVARLLKIFEQVAKIYQAVIHPRAAPEASEQYALKSAPLVMPEQAAFSYEDTLSFLSTHVPAVAECVRQSSVPERARQSAARFLGNLLGSSERFALVREHPDKLTRALQLIAASDYLAGMLIHHPEDMLALDDSQLSGAASAGQMEIRLFEPGAGEPFPAYGLDNTLFEWILDSGLGLREQMALLRRHYRVQKLALCGRDCAQMISIFEALKNWSGLAARSIRTAANIALQALRGAEGLAATAPFPDPIGAPPFAILSLGRLGMREFDLASDADLIFVVPAGTAAQEVAIWAHAGEKIIETLSSYTSDGVLFAVDTRLRPQGQEGELVVTEDALLRYVDHGAKAWEGFTYLKAFPAAGNLEFGRSVAAKLVARVLDRFGGDPNLESELHQMRRRLERELAASEADLKTAPGGYYDVDYVLAYLRLRHRISTALGANTLELIASVRAAGALSEADARALEHGAEFLRSIDHAARLVTGKPAEGIPEHTGHAGLVEELARRWDLLGKDEGGHALSGRLREVQQEVRYVYRRLVQSE